MRDVAPHISNHMPNIWYGIPMHLNDSSQVLGDISTTNGQSAFVMAYVARMNGYSNSSRVAGPQANAVF
jgi:hypothetical protein